MTRLTAKIFPADGLERRLGSRTFIGLSLNNRLSASPARFTPIFKWTLDHTGAFDLLVGDYLNRHNYQAFQGMTESSAIQKSLEDGRQLANSLDPLIAFPTTIKPAIIFAHSLYQGADFHGRLERFRRYYHINQRFKRLIDDAVDDFLDRRKHIRAPGDHIYFHCVEYQLEELVLFELLAEKGYGFLVYAGAQLPIMKSITCGRLTDISRPIESLTLIELRPLEAFRND